MGPLITKYLLFIVFFLLLQNLIVRTVSLENYVFLLLWIYRFLLINVVLYILFIHSYIHFLTNLFSNNDRVSVSKSVK